MCACARVFVHVSFYGNGLGYFTLILGWPMRENVYCVPKCISSVIYSIYLYPAFFPGGLSMGILNAACYVLYFFLFLCILKASRCVQTNIHF